MSNKTFANSSPYWMTLQHRKARSSKPISGTKRGCDRDIADTWEIEDNGQRYVRKLGGWRLIVYLREMNNWDWAWVPKVTKEQNIANKKGCCKTLAEAMKACEEAAKLVKE